MTEPPRYHISANGEPGVCTANISCPLASKDEHYSSKDEARSAYEASMAAHTMPVFNDGLEGEAWESECAELAAAEAELEGEEDRIDDAYPLEGLDPDGYAERAEALTELEEKLDEIGYLYRDLYPHDRKGLYVRTLRETRVQLAKAEAKLGALPDEDAEFDREEVEEDITSFRQAVTRWEAIVAED